MVGCCSLDQFFFRIFRANLDEQSLTWRDGVSATKARIVNQQKISRSFQVGRHHYDRGNDLYQLMLDKRMIYSCGYWRDAASLDQAQEAKLELICRKLQLEPAMRLLDIGCGWGGMAAYAAEKYGVEVIGITVSKEQAHYAREHCRDLPVTIELKDYREITGTFDRVVSIGMFEHVGHKNYRVFMQHQKKPADQRRPRTAAYHRPQQIRPHRGKMDRSIHLPQFDAALSQTDNHRCRGTICHRGLAQFWDRL